MIYELHVSYTPGERTLTGVYAGTHSQMAGWEPEHYDRLTLLQARCNSLDAEGRKWKYGKLTAAALNARSNA